MTARLQPWLLLAAIGLLSGALAGCTDDSATDTSSPKTSATSSEDSSSAQVDTPKLRAQKAAAGIDPCPTDTVSSAGELPDVTLPCLGGGPDVDLAGIRGPAIVNLWATYCGPCRSEAPILQEAHDLLGDQLQVIGIDYQEPQPGKAIAFAEELGLTYPMLSDPEVLTKPGLSVPGLPVTVLVDADGKIAYRMAGPIESTDQLAELLDEHLGISDDWTQAS